MVKKNGFPVNHYQARESKPTLQESISMSKFSWRPRKAFRFKPDKDFERTLAQSQEGILCAAAVMILLGHRPAPSRLEDISTAVFKDPQKKRNYRADFTCVRCGARFESKWKAHKGIKIGPQLLEAYNRTNTTIVFTFPRRILVVEAKELWRHRAEATYKTNPFKEPYLDFKGIPVHALLTLKRKPACTYQGGER